MPKSKFVDFKAVKSALSIEQVLEHYGLLDKFKRSGDSLSGPCPIHKGSNPTQFRVSLSKNVWNCFSECKHGGNTLDFIAKMENVSIHAAAQKAIEWFHLDPDAMSADAEQEAKTADETPKSENVSRPRPASQAAPAKESGTPNKPLKFRLDKLQADHPYLAERGLAQRQFAHARLAAGHRKSGCALPAQCVSEQLHHLPANFDRGHCQSGRGISPEDDQKELSVACRDLASHRRGMVCDMTPTPHQEENIVDEFSARDTTGL